MRPTVGRELTTVVTVYPLPSIMKVQNGETHRYGIVNETPVVIEHSTRTIIRTWPQPIASQTVIGDSAPEAASGSLWRDLFGQRLG